MISGYCTLSSEIGTLNGESGTQGINYQLTCSKKHIRFNVSIGKTLIFLKKYP
jgi:hypothetical protein